MRPLKFIICLCLFAGTPQLSHAQGNPNLACSIWPGIASSATKAQVEAFLSECQNGIFHRLAKARLGELKGVNTQTKAPPVTQNNDILETDEEAESLHNRAKDYQNGTNGQPQDYQKALSLFKQAARKGYKRAMTDLGWMMENGLGTTKDPQAAKQWYEKAANLGESMAINNLGWMYTEGKHIDADYDKAVRYYRRAIALGEPLAMTNLGWLYETGKGVELNYKQAFKLYSQAANAGDLQGLHNTGWMYAIGRGIKRSSKKAANTIYKAIRKGNQFSINQMTTNFAVWPENFRKALQQELKDNGFYSGPTDGIFNQQTIDAVKRAQH